MVLVRQRRRYLAVSGAIIESDVTKWHSPAYIGGANEFLLTPRLREGHARLTEAVRRGGTALGEGTLEPENPDWVKFAWGHDAADAYA